MSFICCNYWLVKTFAEPFLNTSHAVQTLVHGSSDCILRSTTKLNFGGDVRQKNDEENLSKYEDERKGRNTVFTTPSSTVIAKILYYTAIFIAYTIILCFIYASFTV